MRQCDPIGLAKAVLWEEAKGKLRALAAADGSQIDGQSHFEMVANRIEAFIIDFEEDGLHE